MSLDICSTLGISIILCKSSSRISNDLNTTKPHKLRAQTLKSAHQMVLRLVCVCCSVFARFLFVREFFCGHCRDFFVESTFILVNYINLFVNRTISRNEKLNDRKNNNDNSNNKLKWFKNPAHLFVYYPFIFK